MNAQSLYPSIRWLSFAVLLLMAAAVSYAGVISIAYWPGIAV